MQRVNIEKQYMLGDLVGSCVKAFASGVAVGTVASCVLTCIGNGPGYEALIAWRCSSVSSQDFTCKVFNIKEVGGVTTDFYVDSIALASNSAYDSFVHGIFAGTKYAKLEFTNNIVNSSNSSYLYANIYDLG